MKIVLNSYTGIGAYLMLRLQAEGHRVDYHLMDKNCQNILRGIVPTPELGDVDYNKYELSIFDLTGKPRQAEQSAKVTPTIGDGNLHSKLEDDRLFGIEVMEQAGVLVPNYEVFDDIEAAKKFVRKTKKRYVFKPNGGQNQSSATTYCSHSWEDLLEYFDKLSQFAKGEEFLLQEFIEGGTEISTEAYFNGERFFLINATLEEKKFLNGNLGPATGCSGNVVWFYDQLNPPSVFKEGLEKLGEVLRGSFRGMIDLNSIVTQDKLYGLEWTPRFGYDASNTLFTLVESDLGEFLHAIACGEEPDGARVNSDFAAGIRFSIPPYPSEIKGKHPEGIPVGGISEDDLDCYYLYDVMLDGNNLVSSGEGWGNLGTAFGRSPNMKIAMGTCLERLKKLKVPDIQYRTDLYKYFAERYDCLAKQGWLR